MESGKILQNPRPSPSLAFTNNNNKATINELAQKQPAPTIEKFRLLFKQREEDARVGDGDGPPPPRTEEIVQLYGTLLGELTFNSKPIITDLTIIAGEQKAHGEGIADAICSRIVEVLVEQKLPSLYLLDSIVKNIGKEYVRHFSSRLPEVFCEAYRQVHPDLYPAMQHLFGTWSSVFPPSVLHKIEIELQFSSQFNKQSSNVSSLRASESPRPTHGIHVNPKYIRQLDHSNTDNNIQQVRGTSSNLKTYGQKPAIGYDDFDSDHAEATSSQVGAQRLNPIGSVGRASFAHGANKLNLSSTTRLARPLSPSRIGADRILSAEVDDFALENSPRRLEGASASHVAFDYGRGRAVGRSEDMNEWRNHNRFGTTSTSYNLSNGLEHQGPRALIDAYGSDSRVSNNKRFQVGRLGINGMDNKVASRSWKNTEEEEFDWEDMSPTLADSGRKNDFVPSVPPYGSIGARLDFRKSNAVPLDFDIRSNHSSQAQLPLLNDSSLAVEDSVSLGSGRGTVKASVFQSDPNQNMGIRHPQESWNVSHHFSQSSHPLNARGRGRDSQMPFSGSAVPSLDSDKVAPLIDKLPDADEQFVRPLAAASRMRSSGLDSVSVGAWPASIQSSTGVWAPLNVHKPHLQLVYPLQKQTRAQFDSINTASNIMNQVPSQLLYMPEKQLNNSENKELSLMKPPQLPNQHTIPNHENQGQPQFLPSQEVRNNFLPSIAASVPPHLIAPPLNNRYAQQGKNTVLSMAPLNSSPADMQLPLPIQSIPNSSLHLQGGAIPPLPSGPSPASSQMAPGSQSAGLVVPSQPPGNAFSGLINSLMAQGLISLTKHTPVQDSVGLEFNADLLKLRHESAITDLYAILPRQCTTCGLRFKCQEEHSSHMDWHVTKNRMSKNCKKKPSRKWFVSASMWLSGAEAVGTDAVPGFLPLETVMEKKDDEDLAVPADEDQNACALCGEPFDDFFSDQTEEWMYKGAVYMNASNGSTAGMDRFQLGPIVHAKCRSESSVVSPEDFRCDDGESNEEGSQRKRLKS